MYDDLRSGGYHINRGGEGIMKVTRETFLKWVTRLPETVTNGNVVQHSVWIVPSPFCAMI